VTSDGVPPVEFVVQPPPAMSAARAAIATIDPRDLAEPASCRPIVVPENARS
jgi:hypothetical protein